MFSDLLNIKTTEQFDRLVKTTIFQLVPVTNCSKNTQSSLSATRTNFTKSTVSYETPLDHTYNWVQ